MIPLQLRDDLPGGRRQLRMQLGPFTVTVLEVPGQSLSEAEWADVRLARRSYEQAWGSAGAGTAGDPMDGREDTVYDTVHYLAWIRDAAHPAKLLTMRKVRLDPSRMTPAQLADPFDLLPPDLQFWHVQTRPGPARRLWDAVKAHARSLAPSDDVAEFRISCLGRVATFPFRETRRTPWQRDRTAIAMAAIQRLATDGDSSLLYVSTFSPELHRALGLTDLACVHVPPAVTTTEEVLGLPPGSVVLDNQLPAVLRHKAALPGYWLDPAGAAQVLADLLDEGRLTIGDLGASIVTLIQQETAQGHDREQMQELLALVAAADHRRLAAALTRPHLSKYLIPLLTGDRPLNRMPAAELRGRLLTEPAARPFSATLVPDAWSAGARTILAGAEEKYGEAERPARPTAPAPSSARSA